MVLIPTSRLMRSANGTWKPGPRVRLALVAPFGLLPHDEQSLTSTPRAFSSCAIATLSSSSQPPSMHSPAKIRTTTGLSFDHTHTHPGHLQAGLQPATGTPPHYLQTHGCVQPHA